MVEGDEASILGSTPERSVDPIKLALALIDGRLVGSPMRMVPM